MLHEKTIIETAFDHLRGFMIIYKDIPWEHCRRNIVSRARPYELKNIQELADIYSKFKSTFLEICMDHKIPCIVINEPALTAHLLSNIRNPTIDTETMG